MGTRGEHYSKNAVGHLGSIERTHVQVLVHPQCNSNSAFSTKKPPQAIGSTALIQTKRKLSAVAWLTHPVPDDRKSRKLDTSTGTPTVEPNSSPKTWV